MFWLKAFAAWNERLSATWHDRRDGNAMSNLPRVFVACSLPPEVLAPFVDTFKADHNLTGRTLTRDELIAAAADIDVLVVTATDRVDEAMIDRLPPSVRVICTYSVGTDHIDLDAVRRRRITVLNTPDVLSESCADVAILLMLGAARRVIEAVDLVRSGAWTGWTPGQLLGGDVWGRRLGILGMGRIGRAIATRARGFGMRIHYHNRSRLAADLEVGATYHACLTDLAEQSDIFCIACPAGPETRGLVDADFLARLPRGAIVTNISRGDIIDDEALVAALGNGRVAAAGLDVFAGEPDIHHAYRTLPNVFGLPHIGSATVATRHAMALALCEGVQAHFTGGKPQNRLC
jgi:glyoxylate reductase